MRPYQIFASMEPAESEHFFRVLAEGAPGMFAQMIHAAAAAMKSRPAYVNKLAFDKKASAIRRALARVNADALSEETLAVYFLECRNEVLCEWLDSLGLKHSEGSLEEDAPEQPDAARLREATDKFLQASNDGDRTDRLILLRAFAAQSAIDWPELDAILESA